jgi:hypothetical protein
MLPPIIPYRIKIGITGHRILKEPERIASKVREALNSSIYELFDRPFPMPESITPFAFTVVTALAEGADRLVAREVLKFPDSEIEVILPFIKNKYKNDFTSSSSKKEFEELYRLASNRTILERQPEKYSKSTKNTSKNRGNSYQEAGQKVIDECDLLIAVWDGKPAKGIGGTGEIVAYASEKQCPIIIISANGQNTITIEKWNGLRSGVFQRLEMFNSFSIPEETVDRYIGNVYKDIFETAEGENIPEILKANIKQKILPFYVRSSLLAKQNQMKYLRAGMMVYVLSPIAVAVGAAGMIIHSLAFAVHFFEILLLAAILVIIFQADKNKVHKKWIESRFLTERIRSSVFSIACGMHPSLSYNSLMMKHSEDTEVWTLKVFHEIIKKVKVGIKVSQNSSSEDSEFVRKRWVEEQMNYHTQKGKEIGKKCRFLEVVGKIVFVTAICIASLNLMLMYIGQDGMLNWLDQPIVFLAIILPAIGASIGSIRTHREYSRLEKKHQTMASILNQLNDRYAKATTKDVLKVLLKETEEIMLQETGEWLTLMRYLKIDPV